MPGRQTPRIGSRITYVIIGIDASRLNAQTLTGTERYTRAITAAMILAGAQHAIRLYVRQPLESHDAALAAAANVTVIHIHQPRLWTHFGLARELRASPPDALFVPAHTLPVSFLSAGQRASVRAVVTVHDCGFKRFPAAHPFKQRQILDWGTRLSVHGAHTVIVDSESTRGDVLSFYNPAPAKVRIAHPALLPLRDTTDAFARLVLEKYRLISKSYLIHVGTVHPRKNLRRLIRAWAALGAAKGACKLVLAGGPGWGKVDLQGEVERLGAGDSVRLIGYISDEEKSVLIRMARAYVFPSLHEGFGFPVLEAQSVGVPVLCSNTSSLPEIAGKAALTFDPLDVGALTGALHSILSDDALAATLAADGVRNVSRFSWGDCARHVLDALGA